MGQMQGQSPEETGLSAEAVRQALAKAEGVNSDPIPQSSLPLRGGDRGEGATFHPHLSLPPYKGEEEY